MLNRLWMSANEAVPGEAAPEKTEASDPPCPCCGGRMRVIETFTASRRPLTVAVFRIDSS